jgi:hypothetical protein
MRIIPRKTKVATEFFTGVSLGDIILGAIGVLLIFFIIISNLPYKIGICSAIAAIFVLLLVRIDTEANYMFLLRIVKHFSYHRSYRKLRTSAFPQTEEFITDMVSAYDEGKGKKKKDKKKKRKLKEQQGHEEAAV